MSAVEMSCVTPTLKTIELATGQRWQFFTKRCQRVEATVWDIGPTSPDSARRVHLREDHTISWEATDVEMLTDPTWTLLSSPGDKR